MRGGEKYEARYSYWLATSMALSVEPYACAKTLPKGILFARNEAAAENHKKGKLLYSAESAFQTW